MNYFVLKIIALICMTLDHIGIVLYPEELFFRVIGRVAFPLFAFLLVNGFYHTKDRKKYLMRLILFTAVSEIPFDLVKHKTLFSPISQNIFFTLSLGMNLMIICEYLRKKCNKKILCFCSTFSIAVVISFIAFLFKTDYSWYGVLLIYFFYMFYGTRLKNIVFVALSLFALTIIYCYVKENTGQLTCMLSIPFFIEFKEKRVEINKSVKRIIYWYYPIHLLILYLITLM